jgi:CRISPR type III-A-associated RAMP protein Csm4
METYAVYFRPRSALATWPLSSDLLAGAVCWGIRLLGLMDEDALSGWLAEQQNQPRFAFSQGLPVWLGGSVPLRFYPRPLHFHPQPSDLEAALQQRKGQHSPQTKTLRAELAKNTKQIKGIAYVSETALIALQNGSLKPADLFLLDEQKSAWKKIDRLLCSQAEAKQIQPHLPLQSARLFDIAAVQHNSVDRVGGATVEGALFYKEEVFFAEGVGLWAVLRAFPEDVERWIAPALRLLADTGFGADRSTGRGFFDVAIQPFDGDFFTHKGQAMMTLSRYLPLTGEVNLKGEPLAYQLRTVHPKREQRFPYGVVSDSRPIIFKQAVRMFETGSVFPISPQEKEVFGRWALLSPPNLPPVYQSGAAVMLPL